MRQAYDFYKHPHGWSNRLIAGDSLLVMNSLLEKEGMAGKVQMIYFDPPYGIRYGSNFQPFVHKRDVKDGKDEDLTHEPEMIRAFRDTWELGIHSYLTYLRDRLLLARELLHESGSIFVQIGDENLHRVRSILDEVFGAQNCRAVISARKTAGLGTEGLLNVADYLLWYARDLGRLKTRTIFEVQSFEEDPNYVFVFDDDGTRRRLSDDERSQVLASDSSRLFRHQIFLAAGRTPSCVYELELGGEKFLPSASRSWSTNQAGAGRLKAAGRLIKYGNGVSYIRYASDFPLNPLRNIWQDTASGVGMQKIYVVQTTVKIIQRCLLMATDPGDLVLDPTCGSGTTAFVAEHWGRRWITCDTSRVATSLAKQRLMTALYDYYELAHPNEGVKSGFVYKTVPHVTLRSIANNPDIKEGMTRAQIDAAIAKHADQETLYDQPKVDKGRARVTGPFTVEAVPAPIVKPLDAGEPAPAKQEADASIARSGESLRHAEWRQELLKTGIRGKSGQRILFSRVEPLAAARWLHATAETKPNEAGAEKLGEPDGAAYAVHKVVIHFGPEHAPLEQKAVERAANEAASFVPKPAIIVFAAFQFDPEAAKDIDALTVEKTGMTFLKVQMNADLLTEDLKKKRASNESFWLVGQPDVELRRVESGDDKGKWQIEVRGFDYYNTKTGALESGGPAQIAVWMLDPDYDERSLLPRQVFFPMAGEGEGWARLAKNLRAELDEDAIEAYRGTVSLPFEGKLDQKVAVKVVDDRGIESLRILEIG